MKKITLSLFVLSAAVANAQLPVSHTAGKKNALIEEFTGIHCQYCPDGHKRSDQSTSANPTHVFSVNVHSGSYATPGSGEIDMRTADGTAILAIPSEKVAGFPAGDVNRATCTTPQTAGGIAMNRDTWAAAVSTILSQNAYVNIAGSATLNTSTRLLTINIEAYYTGNSPVSANYLTVMLKQDNILGTQTGGSTWYPAMMVGSQYKHMHALRDVLTAGSLGEAMGATTTGTLYTKTINYTVPASYANVAAVLADLRLIAFVSETSTNIINVCSIPISTTATDVNEVANLVNNVNVFPNPTPGASTISFNMVNANPVSVVLSNMLGQVVLKENLGQLNAGDHNYSFDASNLENGLYQVTLTVGDGTVTKNMTISK
jgi:hypothetical protein